MARSIDEILTQILEAKNAEPNLVSLNSTSKVSLYRLYAYVIAVAIFLHEKTWDLFKVDLEKIAEESNVGTNKWLQRKVLEYQNGSTLTVVNDTVKYSIVDETKRIISRCAIKENEVNRNVLIKVAKEDVSGGLIKLTDAEITGLKDYLNQVKMAGTKLIISSLDSDRVIVNADIYYDASYLPAVVKANVINAITNYLKEIDFSGNIYESKLEDAIQKAEGVKDLYIHSVKIRQATETIEQAVEMIRVFETNAGYAIPEDTTSFTLEDTIILKPFID